MENIAAPITKEEALAEYYRDRAAAGAEYNRVIAAARAEYDRARAAAWAEYERAMAAAQEASNPPPLIAFKLEASGEPIMTIHTDGRVTLNEDAQP
jgi:hypothetical protein